MNNMKQRTTSSCRVLWECFPTEDCLHALVLWHIAWKCLRVDYQQQPQRYFKWYTELHWFFLLKKYLLKLNYIHNLKIPNFPFPHSNSKYFLGFKSDVLLDTPKRRAQHTSYPQGNLCNVGFYGMDLLYQKEESLSLQYPQTKQQTGKQNKTNKQKSHKTCETESH